MALRPEGSTITLGGYTLFVEDIKETFAADHFEREEYKHQKRRAALESSGAKAIIVEKFAGGQAQLAYTCVAPTVRPVTPDDTDLNNIYKRWDKVIYEIVGAPSLQSQVNGIFALSQSHQQLIARYNAHMAFARGDVSIDELATLQSDSIFTSLQTTGTTLSGAALSASLSNVLIKDIKVDFVYEIPNDAAATTSTVYLSFVAKVEHWTLSNASA